MDREKSKGGYYQSLQYPTATDIKRLICVCEALSGFVSESTMAEYGLPAGSRVAVVCNLLQFVSTIHWLLRVPSPHRPSCRLHDPECSDFHNVGIECTRERMRLGNETI